MGTYRKRGDTWRAEINKAGVRESKTFPTKREAQEWAAARETELATIAVGESPRNLLRKCYSGTATRYPLGTRGTAGSGSGSRAS
ncbi:integrase [Bordetella pertussis]|nr:integrase [Bordetella pertussis]